MRVLVCVLAAFVLCLAGVTATMGAAPRETRIAFVVGNGSYAAGALPTAANDAGLIAQTLQAAGFEVVGARDLDAETLRQSYADFLKKVSDSGPDTVAFVYLAGYGLQYGTENYYVPIGANVSRDTDIPIEAIRLSDLSGPLISMNLKARFLVFDAAYKVPFEMAGAPLAGGFSLVDAGPGSLIAYNAAPGTIAPVPQGNYGLYAQSLAAMLREGGLAPDDIFDRVRLRVNDQSKGAEVPWDASKIDTAFRFFDRAKDVPPAAATPEQTAALTEAPIKDLPVRQAYTAAVARDTVESYSQFTAAYGGDPLARRARALLAARRETITWQRTVAADTPDAYWSYLSRYRHGPHAGDARLRLRALAAADVPPDDYQALDYDVPPPPPDEDVYVDQPAIDFDDPEYADYPPPPPPPDYWLPPVPVAFIDLPPPPPPPGLFFLPVPVFVPLPDDCDPPDYVAYPADNYFYGGGGDPGVPYERRINNNSIHRPFPAGAPTAGAPTAGASPGHGALVGAALGAAAVALPAAALARRTALERRGITTPAQLRAAQAKPGGLTSLTRPAGAAAQRNALPGAGGRPLPSAGANLRPVSGLVGAPKSGQPSVNALRPGPSGASEKRLAPNARPDVVRPVGPAAAAAATAADRRRAAVEAARQRASDQRNALQQRKASERKASTERQQRQQQERTRVPERTPPRQPQIEPHRQAPRPQISPRPQIPRPAPRQQFRPPPQQFRPPPQQFRPPPQQFRPPPQMSRPGGFGGGGGGHPAGGGGERPRHP